MNQICLIKNYTTLIFSNLVNNKRILNAAMNAAIFWATKNPPYLRAGYVIDIILIILVAGAGFEPAAFRL